MVDFTACYFYKLLCFALYIMLCSSNVHGQRISSPYWSFESDSDSLYLHTLSDHIINEHLSPITDTTYFLTDHLEAYGAAANSPFALAEAQRIRGIIAFKDYENNAAAKFLRSSVDIAEANALGVTEAKTRSLLGKVYRLQSKPAKALEQLEKSLVLLEAQKDTTRLVSQLVEVGNLYKSIENYDRAIDYLKRGNELLVNSGRAKLKSFALSSLASVYRRTGQAELALSLNFEALEIRKGLQDWIQVASSYNNIGNLYEDKNDFQQALKYHRQAMEIRETEGDTRGKASSYKNMGSNYFEIGLYKESVRYCKRSLELYREIDVIRRQQSACFCLYESYKKLGQPQLALDYLEQIRDIESEIDMKKNLKQIQEMEFEKKTLLDSIAQEREKEELEMDYQRQLLAEEQTRNRVVLILAAVGFLSLLLYYRWKSEARAKKEIQAEREKSDNLLLNILPYEVAQELKTHGRATARQYDNVSVLFTDFKGFTQLASTVEPQHLVEQLNFYFKAFDDIMDECGLEKIKTIGDAYMAAAGVPVPDSMASTKAVKAALMMVDYMREQRFSHSDVASFQMRIGIHTGPIVAGVVGKKKFQYDLWGDTVNIASRMESNGEVGKVNISQSTYDDIKNTADYLCAARGRIEVKGKGKLDMYFVERKQVDVTAV